MLKPKRDSMCHHLKRLRHHLMEEKKSEEPDLFDKMDLENDSGYERRDFLYKEMVEYKF